jgi:hypothetical protein
VVRLIQGKQYEMQLPQKEQPMAEVTQQEQHKMKLLQEKLLQEEQPELDLLQRVKQSTVGLFQGEQRATELPQEQHRTELLQEN